MILYHGSNVTVSESRLVPQNRFLDFGFGFYTTTNKTQAVSFGIPALNHHAHHLSPTVTLSPVGFNAINKRFT